MAITLYIPHSPKRKYSKYKEKKNQQQLQQPQLSFILFYFMYENINLKMLIIFRKIKKEKKKI